MHRVVCRCSETSAGVLGILHPALQEWSGDDVLCDAVMPCLSNKLVNFFERTRHVQGPNSQFKEVDVFCERGMVAGGLIEVGHMISVQTKTCIK